MAKTPLKHLKAADLRGVAQLATQATSGVTRIAEGVHQSVWRTMGVPGGKNLGQACFAVAATLAAKRSALADRLTGDGLVPLHGALGEHEDPTRTLRFATSNRMTAYRTNHMALLNSPAVTQQIVAWLRVQHWHVRAYRSALAEIR